MAAQLFQKILLGSAAIAGVVGLLLVARGLHETAEFRAYQKSMSEVEMIVPKSFPTQSQESIETALLMFSIEVPSTVDGPVYDPELADRGLTTGGLLLPQKSVTIGPAAFTSWSVLGSTLAHELEVHVPQSFFLVVAKDHLNRWMFEARRHAGRLIPSLAPRAKELFENDGTWKAERDAYMHEINNAKRFGLSEEELSSIWRVMDYFYPAGHKETQDAQLSASSENGSETLSEEKVRPSEL